MSIDDSETEPRRTAVKATRSRHERRRSQTRDRIAGTALELFSQRGYDAVTIAEIAEAADVAKQTVVNHFPAKEDLLLAWHRPVEADVVDLIDQLPLSVSLPEFLKIELPRLFAQLPETPETPDDADPRLTGIGEIIMNSPALQDALRGHGARYQENLASILSDRVPAHLGVVAARAIAAFILATVTAMTEEAGRLRAAGVPAEEITTSLNDRVGRALSILDTGLGGIVGSTATTE